MKNNKVIENLETVLKDFLFANAKNSQLSLECCRQ